MMVTSGFARVNGARLYFEVQGSGSALVLLTDGLENTDSHFDALADSFQVIRYDMRGNGKSSEITDIPFEHTKDLLGLLDHLSIAKAIFAELTPGSSIANEFAQGFPESVIKIDSAESLLQTIRENGPSIR